MKIFTRKYPGNLLIVVCFIVLLPPCLYSQQINDNTDDSRILTDSELKKFLTKPACLEGYISNQSGPLYRIGTIDDEPDDCTFTSEKIKILSDSLLINGWLYLPLGEGKFPLIVLTNGGGDGSRAIRSLSDWIAPILAHCGVAAFVHDKRGTGESEGNYAETTYDDYVSDAGNCAIYLAKHRKINPEMIGVLGGSEGGRIAVLAASRYPIFKFVVSFAGTVVSTQEDRIYATMGGLKASGVSDSILSLTRPLWIKSFAAWASNNAEEHKKVDDEIVEWRKKYGSEGIPNTKAEMDSLPELRVLLPTWYSMPNDYLTELEHFNKPWLAIFGEIDQVVPTEASIENIGYYMEKSGNKDYLIAVIPRCGHSPVDVESKRMVRLDNLVLNWLNKYVLLPSK